MSIALRVGRGTITLIGESGGEQAESGQRALSENTIIRTDRNDTFSQANVILRDPRDNNRLIASLTLKGDSSFTIRRATRPRFNWSLPSYEIDVTEFVGDLDILIAEDLARSVKLNVRTPENVWIRLGKTGSYSISATETRVELVNYEGEAIIIAPDRETTRSIPIRQRGIFDANAAAIDLVPDLDNLLANSSLLTSTDQLQVEGNTNFPISWSCGVGPPEILPRADFYSDVSPDGRKSFRMVRSEGADNSGWVRCEQTLGDAQSGLDVTGYDQLILQARVNVDYQSLSACGTVGSECPLMMRINFIDVNGNAREWLQGVYAYFDPTYNFYQLRCDTCFERHVRINEKTWYTYLTDNLFNIFPPESRPARITKVAFYSSGHQFNVYLDEIQLLAGRASEISGDVDGG
jgi:hypothetical protein